MARQLDFSPQGLPTVSGTTKRVYDPNGPAPPQTLHVTLHFDIDASHDQGMRVSLPDRDIWAEWRFELRAHDADIAPGLAAAPVSAGGALGSPEAVPSAWAAVPAWLATAGAVYLSPNPAAGHEPTACDFLLSLREAAL
jgi:hypothetical protein